MRALITGITGFVGLHLADHLLECGDDVLGCALGTWMDDTPARIRRSVALFAWDMSESRVDEVRARVASFAPDSIYHLAALSTPGDCGRNMPSERALAINVGGTRDVLHLASQLDSRPRVLLTSSAYVYAPVSPGDPVVSENAPLGPVDGYGRTKLAAERECLASAGQGIDVVVARAFSQTGPRQVPRFMLPEWASQFADAKAESIRVISLSSHLDLSDVRDTVRAYRLLIQRGSAAGIYNVGSGRGVSSGDVFRLLQRLAGRQLPAIESEPGPRQRPIADIARLTKATDWRPEIPLEHTVADTLAYWRTRKG